MPHKNASPPLLPPLSQPSCRRLSSTQTSRISSSLKRKPSMNGMRPTQRPTATNIRVRSTRDANTLFHAVTLGILPIVSRRLDAADRAALRPGCVYIWEERNPGTLGNASDGSGMGMERFTEGRHWFPSRVRDDFLLYVEKDIELNDHRLRGNCSQSASLPSHGRRQPLVKQTYSAWVNVGNSLKKWHMNAYYTEEALEHLHTVDDIPALITLDVPHECYQRARASGSSSSAGSSSTKKTTSVPPLPMESESSSRRERPSISTSNMPNSFHRYAPFPPSPVSSSNSLRGLSRANTPPLGERASSLNARTNGSLYKTAYSYPPPPPPTALDLLPVASDRHRHPVSQMNAYSHMPPRSVHTPPAGVHLPPLSVPSQMQTHRHYASSSSSASSIPSSPSSQPPALSHSATTATPTPTTASPYSLRQHPQSPSTVTDSPALSSYESPMGEATPPSFYSDYSAEKERDRRTLVPLAALRLSDGKQNQGCNRSRYRMDEEALRAFKSF